MIAGKFLLCFWVFHVSTVDCGRGRKKTQAQEKPVDLEEMPDIQTGLIWKKNDRRQREFEIAEWSTTFAELAAKSRLFVDKTLLIKEFIESKHKLFIVTFPKQWGKSTNLDMLSRFFRLKLDSKGKITPLNKSLNYKLFTQGLIVYKDPETGFVYREKLKTPFRITQHQDLIDKHFGKYPVIHISLKLFKGIPVQTLEMTVRKLRTMIAKIYRNYGRVYANLYRKIEQARDSEETKRANDDYETFRRFYLNEHQANSEYEHSLQTLCRLLSEYYGRKVFVFIDEYDTPVMHFHYKIRYLKEETEEYISFFHNFMTKTFAENEHLEKGMICGVFRLPDPLPLDSAIDIQENNLLGSPIAQYFAFNQKDMELLLRSEKMNPFQRRKAIKWYGCYYIKGDPSLAFFNPNSLGDFFNMGHIIGDWRGSDNLQTIQMIFRNPFSRDIVKDLLNREKTVMNVDVLLFTKSMMADLHEMIFKEKDLSFNQDPEMVFKSYLFNSGYLVVDPVQHPLPENFTSVELVMVSMEVSVELHRKLAEFLAQRCIYVYNHLRFAKSNLIYYIEADRKSPKEFIRSLEKLLSQFRHFHSSSKRSDLLYLYDEYFSKIMELVALEVQLAEDFDIQAYSQKALGPEVVLVNNRLLYGAIIEITTNLKTPQNAFHKAKGYKHVFKKFPHIEKIKFVGINSLSTIKDVQLLGETVYLVDPTGPPLRPEMTYVNDTYEGVESFPSDDEAPVITCDLRDSKELVESGSNNRYANDDYHNYGENNRNRKRNFDGAEY